MAVSLSAPLTISTSHALEIALANLKAKCTTVEGCWSRVAERTTSGHEARSMTTVWALGSEEKRVVSMSCRPEEVEGSVKPYSDAAFRTTEQRRTWLL